MLEAYAHVVPEVEEWADLNEVADHLLPKLNEKDEQVKNLGKINFILGL